MGSQGDIFWADDVDNGRRLRFEDAFPEIQSLQIGVRERGRGNAGLGTRRFDRRSAREFINCSSDRCSGKGVSLGRILRGMARHHRRRLHVEIPCESREHSGHACANVFDIQIQATFQNQDPRDTDSPLGLLAFLHWNHPWNNHHIPGDGIPRAVQLLYEAGVGTVRMDFLWADLEPESGRFSWTRYDHIVDVLRAHDCCILGVLQYNPLWRPVPWNQAPETPAYLRFVRATVEHFKDRVRFWEVWNEPDHRDYWQPQDGLTAYAVLLKSAYRAIKEIDPTSEVLLGGLSQNIPAQLRLIYEKAGKDAFDVANIHPFANPLNPDALANVKATCDASRAVMRAFNDGDKPLWITEVGCPGVPKSSAVKPWWLGENPTEEQQAAWLEQIFAEALAWPNVERVFWAFFRDTLAHFKDGVDYFGIVRNDSSPKPAFTRFQAASRRIKSA